MYQGLCCFCHLNELCDLNLLSNVIYMVILVCFITNAKYQSLYKWKINKGKENRQQINWTSIVKLRRAENEVYGRGYDWLFLYKWTVTCMTFGPEFLLDIYLCPPGAPGNDLLGCHWKNEF